MTRVLVVGRRGQLARALAATAWPAGWDVVFAGRETLDLGDLDALDRFLTEAAPEVVINTAAYTAVDRAEAEPELAFHLNAAAPERLARICRASGTSLIQVSTDYVFGATGTGPYSEDDAVGPVNVYGRSKAEGEGRVLAANPDALIVRTAWLLSPGSGFVAAIIDRALSRLPMRVVADQCGNPTRASDLAEALVRLVDGRLAGKGGPGLVHAAGSEAASWHGLAAAIVSCVEAAGTVQPISTGDYVTSAQRPRDSRLDVSRLSSIHGIEMRPWSEWITETARVGLMAAANRVEKGQQSGG